MFCCFLAAVVVDTLFHAYSLDTLTELLVSLKFDYWLAF